MFNMILATYGIAERNRIDDFCTAERRGDGLAPPALAAANEVAPSVLRSGKLNWIYFLY